MIVKFLHKKDITRLQYYVSCLENFKSMAYSNSILNIKQIEALDILLDISIDYCQSLQYVKHSKEPWVKNPSVLANHKQLKLYRKLLKYINGLISEVNSDNILSKKCKKRLSTYLSLIQCHTVGKCNSKYKN